MLSSAWDKTRGRRHDGMRAMMMFSTANGIFHGPITRYYDYTTTMLWYRGIL